MAFTPRLTAPTDFTTWYGSWNSWNRFGRYYGNCTWYAYGRSGEIANKNIYNEFYITQPPGNGKDWIYNTWQSYTHTSGVIDIQPGDILVWGGGTYGHVEVVEQVLDTTLTVSYALAGNTESDSLYWGLRYINIPTWGSYLGRVAHNDGSSAYLYNTFIGYIHNPYADPIPPTPTEPPTISLVPTSGNIGSGGIELTILASYVPIDEDDPYPLRDMSTGLSRTWITDGWEVTTFSEDDVYYKRVYGKMLITNNGTAPNPSYVRFYKTYTTGYVGVTGTYTTSGGGTNVLIPTIWLKKKKKKSKKVIDFL